MIVRRFLGLSEKTWKLIGIAVAVAIWWTIFIVDPALANDCIEYAKHPQNLVGDPRAMVEDCLRTGYVQAAITAGTAVVTGGLITAGATKALGQGPKSSDGPPVVVPGTETGATGAGTEGDPGTPPEAPGIQQTRDGTPEACRSIWDNMQQAITDAKNTEYLIELCEKHLKKAIDNKQNNLAKLTVQLGLDAANAVDAGAAGVRGSMGLAKGIANAPELLRSIAAAAARAEGFANAIAEVLQEIATLSGNAGRFVEAAQEAGQLSARAEARIADLVREAAAMEGKAGEFDELVRFAKSVDATLLERNAATKTAAAMEQALADAQAEEQAALQRKQSLEQWWSEERATIKEENTKEFNARHEERGDAQAKIDRMKAEHAETAKNAHAEWQAKMDELRKAKLELDKARATIAELQQARTDLLMAEQEVRTATSVEAEATTRFEHAESELAAFDKAAEELEAAKTAIRDMETEEEALVARMETLDKAIEAKQAFVEAETARDAAAAAVDGADAEVRQITAKIDQMAETPVLKAMREQESVAFNEFDAARNQFQAKAREYMDLQGELGRTTQAVDEALEARNGVPPITAQESGRIRTATKNMNDTQAEMMKAQTNRDVLEHRYDEAVSETARQKRANINRLDQSGLQEKLEAATARKAELAPKLRDAEARFNQAAKDVQPYSHPGIDVNSKPKLDADLQKLRADLTAKKYEAASKHEYTDRERAEFDNNVVDAKSEVDQCAKTRADAQKKVTDCRRALEEADHGSGLGEDPGERLRIFELAQARYSDMIKEQEALRVKYEQLASGGDTPEAAALRTRIDQLDNEIHNWREPDYGAEAAKRNPQKYFEYTSEAAGVDKVGPLNAKVSSLTTQVKDAQLAVAVAEQKLVEAQARTGGQSTEALEAQLQQAKTDLANKQSELTGAREEDQTQKTHAAEAEANARKEQAKIPEAEARKRDLENNKREAEADEARLKYQQEHPVDAPPDASGSGIGPMLGSEWTPYHGSDAEAIAKRSHELREAFDDILSNTTKYGSPLVYYTWQGGKQVLSAAGQLFHYAFGGQSPEECAAIIKRDIELVEKYTEKMQELQTQYQKDLQAARDKQHDLELCKLQHS